MTISILIACYNCAEFLDRCIKSILENSVLPNQIIIVNDGSTDDSLKIIETYAKSNRIIKIINQANIGLAATRNVLIKNCETDYFYFLDADDWIEKDCIKLFSEKIEMHQYDLVFSKSYINEKKLNLHSSWFNEKATMQKYAINNGTYFWNILIKLSFWKTNGLAFYDEYRYFEDMGTFTYMTTKTTNVGFILIPTYHYFCNSKSISNTNIGKEKLFALYKQIEHLYGLLKKDYPKKFARYVNDNLALTLSVYVDFVLFYSTGIKKIEYLKMIRKLEKQNPRIRFPISIWKFWFFFLYRITTFFL
ncbi:MAG: glycosyltransferase family 2 protein [Mycoplasmoidaceae bacterium]